MRVRQTMALALCLLVLAGSLPGCDVFRTPYEREKIQEAGGSLKNASKGGAGTNPSDSGGGGGGQKKGKVKEEKKPDKSKAETYREREERKKGTGLLYTVPKALENTTPKLRYSQHLSSEASKVEGVEGATVLIDEKHNAYVGVFSDGQEQAKKYVKAPKKANSKLNIKSEGDLPAPIQEKVAGMLRDSDPLVGTVYVTNDKSHVQSIQRYAREYANGGTNLNSQALAEHIEDVWK